MNAQAGVDCPDLTSRAFWHRRAKIQPWWQAPKPPAGAGKQEEPYRSNQGGVMQVSLKRGGAKQKGGVTQEQ